MLIQLVNKIETCVYFEHRFLFFKEIILIFSAIFSQPNPQLAQVRKTTLRAGNNTLVSLAKVFSSCYYLHSALFLTKRIVKFDHFIEIIFKK